ncbi:hypothetical protein HIM_10410 [Hirsutella minnesotensis 3608]|uniref:BED-type domain-containing protein n=1 Tax=Hirsutella minnesotensis 3608 TaxID=1043627 RepID=A0A0F7ZX66_9HYPO|nr:hypothetical protein HIM_10410 [Hirsutella minnesotensis 3608]
MKSSLALLALFGSLAAASPVVNNKQPPKAPQQPNQPPKAQNAKQPQQEKAEQSQSCIFLSEKPCPDGFQCQDAPGVTNVFSVYGVCMPVQPPKTPQQPNQPPKAQNAQVDKNPGAVGPSTSERQDFAFEFNSKITAQVGKIAREDGVQMFCNGATCNVSASTAAVEKMKKVGGIKEVNKGNTKAPASNPAKNDNIRQPPQQPTENSNGVPDQKPQPASGNGAPNPAVTAGPVAKPGQKKFRFQQPAKAIGREPELCGNSKFSGDSAKAESEECLGTEKFCQKATTPQIVQDCLDSREKPATTPIADPAPSTRPGTKPGAKPVVEPGLSERKTIFFNFFNSNDRKAPLTAKNIIQQDGGEFQSCTRDLRPRCNANSVTDATIEKLKKIDGFQLEPPASPPSAEKDKPKQAKPATPDKPGSGPNKKVSPPAPGSNPSQLKADPASVGQALIDLINRSEIQEERQLLLDSVKSCKADVQQGPLFGDELVLEGLECPELAVMLAFFTTSPVATPSPTPTSPVSTTSSDLTRYTFSAQYPTAPDEFVQDRITYIKRDAVANKGCRLGSSHIWKYGLQYIRGSDKKEVYYCHECVAGKYKQELFVINGTSRARNHLEQKHQIDCQNGVKRTGSGQKSVLDQQKDAAASIAFFWTESMDKFKELLIRWIACCHIAFFQLENRHFRELLLLSPALMNHLPKAARTIRSWVMNAFESKKEQLREELHQARSRVSISFDLWTSPSPYAI